MEEIMDKGKEKNNRLKELNLKFSDQLLEAKGCDVKKLREYEKEYRKKLRDFLPEKIVPNKDEFLNIRNRQIEMNRYGDVPHHPSFMRIPEDIWDTLEWLEENTPRYVCCYTDYNNNYSNITSHLLGDLSPENPSATGIAGENKALAGGAVEGNGLGTVTECVHESSIEFHNLEFTEEGYYCFKPVISLIYGGILLGSFDATVRLSLDGRCTLYMGDGSVRNSRSFYSICEIDFPQRTDLIESHILNTQQSMKIESGFMSATGSPFSLKVEVKVTFTLTGNGVFFFDSRYTDETTIHDGGTIYEGVHWGKKRERNLERVSMDEWMRIWEKNRYRRRI